MTENPKSKPRQKRQSAKSVSKNIPPEIFLKELPVAVPSQFADAVTFSSSFTVAEPLTPDQRQLIVRQAKILLEQNYAHLPLKRAMHAVNPIQRLKLLLQRLDHSPADSQTSEAEFHREMIDIFTSVRDLHTNYLLPNPFNKMVAFLPFMVECCFENGQRKYYVTNLSDGFTHPTFAPGVEVTHWNGVPIERAVLNQAQRFAGSNPEARHARGVQTLTTRALKITSPPDEDWVIVSYRSADNNNHELRFNWTGTQLGAVGSELETSNPAVLSKLGLDLEQSLIQHIRSPLFAPHVVAAEKEVAEKKDRGTPLGDLESALPAVFEARPVDTDSGIFGYLRIRTFMVWPYQDFLNEFLRLISSLPQNGLIIDVRGNGGGVIMNGEYILQTLTPRRIEPEPVQFINTPLNLEICKHNGPASDWEDLSRWVPSMEQSLQTGSDYSTGFPISDPGFANDIGQKYFGPVVLITDALCYGTTDIFAAGFQDHGIGPILGTDGNTGAGGANVWEHRYFVSHILPGSDYQPLPNEAGMRVSIRRTLRVGPRAGTPLEDLGVVPEERHRLTLKDLLHKNVDLINHAGNILATLPVRKLQVTVTAPTANQVKVVAETQGMTRIDAYLADRPLDSRDIQAGQVAFSLTKPAGDSQPLELRGFDDSKLVARYRVSI